MNAAEIRNLAGEIMLRCGVRGMSRDTAAMQDWVEARIASALLAAETETRERERERWLPLATFLEEYGTHGDCHQGYDMVCQGIYCKDCPGCTCGLDAARAELAAIRNLPPSSTPTTNTEAQ